MAITTQADGGDSEDLQALFDTIAGGGRKPPPPAVPEPDPAGDSEDLQALFDSFASPSEPSPVEAASDDMATDPQGAVFNRLGKMARQLHDNLRELGYDRVLEDTVREKIPDARERLTYIAQMTEQAASRVLNAADIAKPVQDQLIARSSELSTRWDRMFANQLSVDEFKALAADTRSYFSEAPAKLQVTNDQLMEIIMAQDFQDLTGQVIKKVVEMAHNIESQMLKVLIEVMPEARKAEAHKSDMADGLMNGPVINATGRSDVVTSQAQVDDLLESLGF
jgi:chemotaxis protein CheZ